jgi:hypothetical protein
MNALPNNVVAFELPKKPKVRQKEAPPDQRKLAVVPIKAATDNRLTDGCVRVLIVLCSYCNRAGITWVSQARLASDMGVTRQAITNQIAQLRKNGYVEIVKKSWRGERANTLRVIFDSTIDTETAIAVTSPIEDTRPPVFREQQMQEEQEQIDRAGQARIAQMIAKGLRTINQPKERTMPKEGDTLAVKKMKESIQKAQSKRSKAVDKSESIGQSPVSNGTVSEVANEGSHRQPIGHSTVSQNTENTVIGEVYKGNSLKENININKSIWTVLCNSEVEELKSNGLTDTDITEGLDILTAAYKAEGLTPKSQQLVAGLLQMHRDAR